MLLEHHDEIRRWRSRDDSVSLNFCFAKRTQLSDQSWVVVANPALLYCPSRYQATLINPADDSQASATSKKNSVQLSMDTRRCLSLSSHVTLDAALTTTRRISTAQKMIQACNILSIPIYATTQSALRLGPVCSELSHPPLFTVDKTAFSMMVPELRQELTSASPYQPFQVAIVGIESHICVTQTALDLLADGHGVYVIADGVSSCNEGERDIALARLRAAGAVITTSESWLYECMGDAAVPE